MIFLSAGHHSKALVNLDSGAVGVNGLKEGDVTIEFRDLVAKELDTLSVKYIKDRDLDENLSQYLKRIETGNASVVVEYHCNAFNAKASGTEVIIEEESDVNDVNFAKELNNASVKHLSIPDRGVKKESQSARGKLGLMRKDGIIALVELFFIDNIKDVTAYNIGKFKLAKEHALIIKKYEDLIK